MNIVRFIVGALENICTHATGAAGRPRGMMILRYSRRKFDINIPRTLDINLACIKTLCTAERRYEPPVHIHDVEFCLIIARGLDFRYLFFLVKNIVFFAESRKFALSRRTFH